MKRLLLFSLILLIGAFCSACANSLAVYQLNEKAVALMNDGDIKGAISRFQASVDLDPNVFDSRYNLASSLLKIGECEQALEHAKAAAELNPKAPIANYTLAVAYECSAENFIKEKDEDGETVEKTFDNNAQKERAYNSYIEYIQNANDNYDKYITLIPNAEDTQKIIDKISENKKLIQEHTVQNSAE